MSDIKICPFCGASPTIRIFKGKDGWRDRYAVLCRYDEGGCGAESGLYHYEAEAIEAWNKRTQPERKKDIIQKFHDYQVEWLKSHYDIELEPQLEEMIVRFLHDTANCYMMEVEHEDD